jgi:hypothetical protein
MQRYKVNWVECRLPGGQDFAVAVCGYSGKVCYMTLGNDIVTRMLVSSVVFQGEQCQSAQHCLALGCQLNQTERGHMLHMLEMFQDETLDQETTGLWGTGSALEALVLFAEKMNDIVPDELRQREKPETV